MQVNGQCQQIGQLQFTHPHLSYNANGSNRGYENNTSYHGVGALVGHYTMDNVGVKQHPTQRQNNFLAVNNPLPPSSHQDCYPNSAQNASSQNNNPHVSLNQQVMLAQKTSVSGNPQSAVLNSNVAYYQSQLMLQKTLNQSLNPRTENVSVPMTSLTTSPTMQRMCYTQQSAVQSPMYSQASQQAACPPYTFPYTQNINVAFSNVPNPQNAQIYTISPVTLLSTSCAKKVVANNQSVQNNCFVSQTSDNRAVHSAKGCAPLSNLMVTNNPNSQSNSLTAFPVQTQYPPYQSQKNVHQTSVRGNINMQTAQPVIPANNDNHSLNTSSALLPSQTCVEKSVSAKSNLKNMSAAPLQTTMPTKDHSVRQLDNSLFYQKMNDVTNNLSLCTPLNQASELSRCEVFAKIDTVSSAQAKDCSLQVSPGRATRAVAVVLPLSQESSPSKQPSPSSLSSSNPASGSGFFSSNQLDKAPVQTPDTLCLNQLLQQSSGRSSNISPDKANAQAPSPSRIQKQLSVRNEGTKLSALPLTFAQLVEGFCTPKLSRRRKSKPITKKAPTVQKPSEEELSSVPTTEWTLKMLRDKILELENKETEHKKSENKHDKYDSVTQIVCRFWNGDCKALLHDARNGTLSKEMSKVRDFCSKIAVDTVIFSQNQSSHPSKYHVLLHDEVYEEKTSYTSSWLNVNQLDDIDKEFDLPYSLKYGKNGCKSIDAEPKSKLEDNFHTEIKAAISKPEELNNKDDPSKALPNPICSIPSVNSLSDNTEKHNTLAHSDPDTEKRAEENKCVSNAQSNDSSYSFKIEVLPPEEAKVIFEQVERDSPQVTDTAVSEEIPPSAKDNTEKPTYHVSTLEKICCIEKWKEKVFGLSSESKCKCEDQDQDEENLGQLVNKNCWPMGIVDLTEDDDISVFTKESGIIQENKSPNKSTITVSGESEDESQVSENNYAAHTEHEQDLVISTESKEDVDTNKDLLENSNANENEMTTSDQSEEVQGCRKEPEEPAKPASSQAVSGGHDVKENNMTLASDNPDPLQHPFKKPKLSSHLKSQTILESFSKCKNSGRVETVELALFGSKLKKSSSGNRQQSQYSDSHTLSLSEETEEAPKRLYVKFSPFTKSDKQEAEPSGNSSVKKRIHENWRSSFPLTTIRLKRKNKKFAIVSGTPGATVHLHPSKHKDKRAASKRKIQDSDDGQCREKKRSRGEKAVNILKKPVDVEVRPLQENVLKFNVLPNTFNFEDGSNERDSTTDSKADEKTVPVPAEGTAPTAKTKGAWCDESTSKSSPQSPALVPESSGLFQEFQRRYKMRQASTDE